MRPRVLPVTIQLPPVFLLAGLLCVGMGVSSAHGQTGVVLSAAPLPATVEPGATVALTVTVLNNGPTPVENWHVSFSMTPTVVSVDAPGWECHYFRWIASPMIAQRNYCIIGTLPVSEPFTIVITYLIGPTAYGAHELLAAWPGWPYWYQSDYNPREGWVGGTVLVNKVTPDDSDGDGLLNAFETAFGLDPAVATGDDGPLGDPDHDQVKNFDEQAEGTHPRGFFQAYLAEGSTGPFFDERLALLNPDPSNPAHVLIGYALPSGTTAPTRLTLGPHTRQTVAIDTVPGLNDTALGLTIESDVFVVADRTLTWDASGYGAHAETASPAPALNWLFAEGSTVEGLQTFYLVQNPSDHRLRVYVQYAFPAPRAPVMHTYDLAAHSRLTIWPNAEPDLAGTDLAVWISAWTNVPYSSGVPAPIVAERAMYRDTPGQVMGAGTASMGVTAAVPQWFLAEGATGPFFDTFVLISNPNAMATPVELRYLTPDGRVITRTYTIMPNSRHTVWVDYEDPALADTAVSTIVRATNGAGIVVERAMWWGDTTGGWYEGHASRGATATATRWTVSEGETGGARGTDTFLLLANPTDTTASVRVTLMYEDGTTAERTFAVGANSRFNVWTRAEFPESLDKRYGATIESLGPAAPGIFVERSMYWDAAGQAWAAGTNALAAVWPQPEA